MPALSRLCCITLIFFSGTFAHAADDASTITELKEKIARLTETLKSVTKERDEWKKKYNELAKKQEPAEKTELPEEKILPVGTVLKGINKFTNGKTFSTNPVEGKIINRNGNLAELTVGSNVWTIELDKKNTFRFSNPRGPNGNQPDGAITGYGKIQGKKFSYYFSKQVNGRTEVSEGELTIQN